MITFRRFTILFFILLLSLNLWIIIFDKSPGGFIQRHATLVYCLLFSGYFGFSFSMAFLPCSNFHLPVICHGSTDERFVSLTFDDGPGKENTPVILDVLKEQDVKATFFCIGRNLSTSEQLLKRMAGEGHLIGNHSFSHSYWFDLFSAGRMRAEVIKTNKMIEDITGKLPLLFRPPFGVVNPMVRRSLKFMDLHVVCWNIRSLDTIERDPRKIKKRILRQLTPGSIILLHDHTQFSIHHLDDLITAIKEAGYGIVPLDQLLKLKLYA
jgi:peptidoglycan/xylan/chitin deacetylase (PgdA/CDA1 family)